MAAFIRIVLAVISVVLTMALVTPVVACGLRSHQQNPSNFPCGSSTGTMDPNKEAAQACPKVGITSLPNGFPDSSLNYFWFSR